MDACACGCKIILKAIVDTLAIDVYRIEVHRRHRIEVHEHALKYT